MKILIDMNSSAEWTGLLESEGHEARHWFDVGDPRAADRVIMEWARVNGFVVFTHDLDFGMLLASTRATGPSVIQVRVQDPFPSVIGSTVMDALRRFESELNAGAIVLIDPPRNRPPVANPLVPGKPRHDYLIWSFTPASLPPPTPACDRSSSATTSAAR